MYTRFFPLIPNRKVFVKNVRTVELGKILLPEDRSWKTWFKRRLIGFGVFLKSLLILPINCCKAVLQLTAARPIQAVKTLLGGIVGTFVFSLTALAVTFIPPLGRLLLSTVLLPAKFIGNEVKKKQGEKNSSQCVSKIIVKNNNLLKRTVEPLSIETDKGKVDAAILTQAPYLAKKPSNYIIEFLGNAQVYQHTQKMECSCHLSQGTRRNVLVCNYPGAYPFPSNYSASDARDLVNVGIAAVWLLAKRNNWNNADIEQHLQLSGSSLGGAVALQVAVYFKEKFDINLSLHVDRSFSKFSHVVAHHASNITSTPIFYTNKIVTSLLYSGGGWEFDSIAAYKKLQGPSLRFHYLNLINEEPLSFPKSFIERLRDFFGFNAIRNFFFGEPVSHHPDPVIPTGLTLADAIGISRDNSQPFSNKQGSGTKEIYTKLSCDFSAEGVCKYYCYRHTLPLWMFKNGGPHDERASNTYFKVALSFDQDTATEIQSSSHLPRKQMN